MSIPQPMRSQESFPILETGTGSCIYQERTNGGNLDRQDMGIGVRDGRWDGWGYWKQGTASLLKVSS